jgi:uncharacterized membrane protein
MLRFGLYSHPNAVITLVSAGGALLGVFGTLTVIAVTPSLVSFLKTIFHIMKTGRNDCITGPEVNVDRTALEHPPL